MKYIITGTSSGLGFCLAERLISQGHVAGISRSIGKSSTLSSSGRFNYYSYDLSQTSNEKLFNGLIENLLNFIDGDPYTLILNAAGFYTGINRLSYPLLATLFEVNLFSIMNLVRRLDGLTLRRVLIINSISGLLGQCEQHEYSASKHAVMGYARSLSKSAKNSDYDVMCVNPGGMKTELWSGHDEIDSSDFLNPEVVADVCISLLLIPQRSFIESMIILPPSDV